VLTISQDVKTVEIHGSGPLITEAAGTFPSP
jgi:hypothetical protein